MKKILLIFSLLAICSLGFISYSTEQEQKQIQRSIELVGAGHSRQGGLTGHGVKVGVIDTGIDYAHSDLHGFGKTGKVVGGHSYVGTTDNPIDTNGHGTEVAGIIGANGNFTGIAPNSELYSYRVSSTGEAVSSEYIIQAVSQAIEDKTDVINISLGINRTNDNLESAVDEAVNKGITVVTAAGNSGPDLQSIGSPGRDINVITVGASYNNLTTSLVSTLEIKDKKYLVLPMLGTNALENQIQAKMVYGGYGRIKDLQNLDVKDSILLEERGSNIKGEKVFFTEKEKNAADFGAKGLIVFNNQSGFFFGELTGPNSTNNYHPRIPVISMSGEDGVALQANLGNITTAKMNVFFHPDYVAPFSSRGPVSPFYIKPDLVAPGVFVNTTTIGGKYNLTSGTSIAAPHVTGAVAILLEKYPHATPDTISSLLTTTTDPVTDAYGNVLPLDVAGSGRLNLTRAESAGIVFTPHTLVFDLSDNEVNLTRSIHLKSIHNSTIPRLDVKFSSLENGFILSDKIVDNTINFTLEDTIKKYGRFYGFITISDSNTVYRIPVLIYFTKGTLHADQDKNQINITLDYPDKWIYTKITLQKAGSQDTKTTSLTPQHSGIINIDQVGEYWMQAEIQSGNITDHAYRIIHVSSISENQFDLENILHIPIKYITIVLLILLIAIIVGFMTRRN